LVLIIAAAAWFSRVGVLWLMMEVLWLLLVTGAAELRTLHVLLQNLKLVKMRYSFQKSAAAVNDGTTT
jgi:hypothetical protein